VWEPMPKNVPRAAWKKGGVLVIVVQTGHERDGAVIVPLRGAAQGN
jgi:hypothetical protein